MIEQFRSPSGDNYSYVIYDRMGGTGCIVDPVASERVRNFLREKSLRPVILINTHGHGDHTGANGQFKDIVSEFICHPEETDSIREASRTINDGETIPVGGVDVKALHTPGHTAGGICLKTDEAVISGDTVFLAGCGNPQFGGDTRQLFETFRDKIRPLDDELILYPGHDYARRNLNFAMSLESDNPAVDRKLDSLNREGEPESTLGEEHKYNPFFRYDDPELITHLDGADTSSSNWEVFRHLRQLRNQW